MFWNFGKTAVYAVSRVVDMCSKYRDCPIFHILINLLRSDLIDDYCISETLKVTMGFIVMSGSKIQEPNEAQLAESYYRR